MGQVTHVTPFSSTVLLITDTSHALPVQVLRNGLRTIAVGTGRIDELRLPYLPTNSDIIEGDLLGIQYAGVFNIVGRDTTAAQWAGVFNINEGDTSFLQASAHTLKSKRVLPFASAMRAIRTWP